MGFCQTQVGKQLRFMNRQELFHCLQLKNKLVRKKEIHDQIVIQNLPFANQGNAGLSLKTHSTQTKFFYHAFLVNGFEQSRPHFPMNLNSRTYDSMCQRIFFFHVCCFFLFLRFLCASVSLWLTRHIISA